MDLIDAFLGRNGLLPHGYCLSNSPGLLWSMVLADGLIAAAYFAIPLAILRFVRQRSDIQVRGLAWLFSAFIFACGLTHVLDIWTLWMPDYALQTLTKLVTAGLSVATSLLLWRLVPKAVQIPTLRRLQGVIQNLEAEVAQRRSAQEQLAEVQENLAVTLASIGAAFLATDREGRVTRMNSVAERILGWPQDEAVGRSVWEVFQREGRPPEYRDRNPVDVLIEQGYAADVGINIVALGRDGTRTPVEVKAAATHAVDGGVRGMALVFRDMSSVLRAQAESARLAAIVESSSDAIIGKTLDGRIVSWNRGAEQMFGYTAEQAIGQPVQMLMPPERRSEEMRILAELARGASVPAFDAERITRDGRRLQISVSISPIRDSRGRIIGASKIARDVTEQRLAEAALRDSERMAQRLEAENRQIQAASRLKSQFVANMSHELRTPLNAIIGFADLLRGRIVPPDSPKRSEYLGHIASSGRHLLKLINDVLDLSKVESGKLEFFPEPVDLQVVIDEVRGVLLEIAQRKSIGISVAVSPQLGPLVLDPARLKQVLYNYLSNALKFTPEGGSVSVRAMPEGEERWRLEVQDTGVGIAAADLPRLFNDFQQLDTGYAKQHQGTGLGLALTRRLVEAQGGSVGVSSTPGVGSVFHLVMDRVQRAGVADIEASPGSAPADGAGPHLLVVQGDPDYLSRLLQLLGDAGHGADGAGSGEQALRLAMQRDYQAITLDLLLPDASGLSLLGRLRSEGRNAGAPVVGVSMLGQENVDEPGAAPRAMFPVADVLFKPLHAEQVARALARYSDRRPRAARVMVVDDDPLALSLMQATLAGLGIEAVCIADGRQGLREMAAQMPDALVLDLMMPAFDGFAVLDALQALPGGRELPVFVWTSMLLSDADLMQLANSARAILLKGGGTLQPLLHRLQQTLAPEPPR